VLIPLKLLLSIITPGVTFFDINLHVGITQGRYRDDRPSSGFSPTQLHQPLQFEQKVDLEIDYLLEL